MKCLLKTVGNNMFENLEDEGDNTFLNIMKVKILFSSQFNAYNATYGHDIAASLEPCQIYLGC